MTQRNAIFVGCRLLAVYLVAEAAAAVIGSIMSMGYFATIASGSGPGMGNLPFTTMFQGLLFPAVARGGIAVFVWSAAATIARAAANPDEGDSY